MSTDVASPVLTLASVPRWGVVLLSGGSGGTVSSPFPAPEAAHGPCSGPFSLQSQQRVVRSSRGPLSGPRSRDWTRLGKHLILRPLTAIAPAGPFRHVLLKPGRLCSQSRFWGLSEDRPWLHEAAFRGRC